MNKISAKIIADSVDNRGNRITSYVLTFPRFILAELNTHRVFSKNAIPFKKMVEKVKNDPFIPIAWQKDHKGMQGKEYETEIKEIERRNEVWVQASRDAIRNASELNRLDTTKQLCNRLLEPFMWHTVILTGTEFDNFFKLRCPQYKFPKENKNLAKFYKSKKDLKIIHHTGSFTYTQGDQLNGDVWQKTENVPENIEEWLLINKGQSEIHMMELAECMWDAMNESKPNKLKPGEYHIPFGDMIDDDVQIDKILMSWRFDKKSHNPTGHNFENLKIKIATARCARVSYLNYEGKDDYEADVKLYDRLSKSSHWSPFEHVAKCMNDEEYETYVYGQQTKAAGVKWAGINIHGWCRNYRGFIQLREEIENENIK